MSILSRAALAAVFATGLATQIQAQSADTVVATVNGVDITLGHMAVLYGGLPEQYQQLPAETLYQGILDQLIQQTALGQTLPELSERGVLQMENEERALRAQEVIAAAVSDAVTDEALQVAYDEMIANAGPEVEYNANHILLESEEDALALLEEIRGGADFEEMARQHSTGPSGPNGGALGWFSPGMMVQPFEEAVFDLSVGEVSEPVQTQFGWHLIKLNETRNKAVPTLDEVRGELAEEVREATIVELVDSAVAGATIERSNETIDPAVLSDQSLFSR